MSQAEWFLRQTPAALMTRRLSAADLVCELVLREADAASRRGYFQEPSPHPDDYPDAERAAYRALSAFQRGAFVLLIDGHRVTGLDTQIYLGPETRVRLFRPVPFCAR